MQDRPANPELKFQDIAEEAHAADRLRESERRFRDILSTVHMVAMTLDGQGDITFCNDYLLSLTGWKREEILGRNWCDLFVPPGQYPKELLLSQLVAGTVPAHRENEILTKLGERRLVSWNNTILRDDAGNPNGTASIGEDITERKRTEIALHQSEHRFREIVHNLPGIVFQFYTRDNGEFGLYYVGGRSEELFGLVLEPLGTWHQRFVDCLLPKDRGKFLASVEESVRTRTKWDCEARFLKPGGGELYFRGMSRPTRLETETVFNGILLDITDRKRLEDQFQHAQKLESVGRLAGGVAHDFNNLLTVINGYSGFLLNQLHPRDSLRSHAEEILKAGQRAAGLTAQLLAFSRKQIIEPKPLVLNHAVNEAKRMLQRIIGEDIELVTELEPSLGRVMADSDQVHQVIMNLAVNARDAITDCGRLSIVTRNVTLDQNSPDLPPDISPGHYVLLSISDNGVGMTDAIRESIFEPFFTTKEQGKGTGLGLATVYGIVRQNNGWILVESEPGKGSTFKIFLPRLDDVAAPQPKGAFAIEHFRGTETILLVEDQPAVRTLVNSMLSARGYHVLEVPDGLEALEVERKYSDAIHLAITDIVLPRMNGRELFSRLRATRPDIKVLYISGYPADVIAERGVLEPGVAFLSKPFTADELAAKVREVLGEPTERDRQRGISS
ncbi:MAG TPA: PAS domain S-box protein [Candidatus Solibacter sp.]